MKQELFHCTLYIPYPLLSTLSRLCWQDAMQAPFQRKLICSEITNIYNIYINILHVCSLCTHISKVQSFKN